MASLLKNGNYTELNTNHLKKANYDWLTNPQARYAVSQMFAGCILLDGTKAIIINCVESYGRKKEDLNSSIPDLSYHYKQACVKLFESDNSSKLVIRLFSCNLLITSSCTLSKYPVIYVGPSTNSFTPSKNTKIFLHEKYVEMADKLFNDNGCSQLYSHNILNQCKQEITLNILESSKNLVNPFIEKKTLDNFQDKGGQLAATVKEMLKLLGKNECIAIIDNKDLDKHLRSITQSMSSSLCTANETVKERLTKKFF
ncbi:uncharacterized protein BX663DRAFT_544169 [Cokeromyces recurvatus]|uniref:uncharacterized protein n=1 Tax=Cokeromyces recurvatus TaxID=90255 RepID=UPI00221E4ECA|nr:uncharacterized protein BX663DRAFT_544169 [Cokeromyces recurvatus]KAI7901412.1 hypothetical protein BX663DRAFT_544169 [Cokeromyces recurvatus]